MKEARKKFLIKTRLLKMISYLLLLLMKSETSKRSRNTSGKFDLSKSPLTSRFNRDKNKRNYVKRQEGDDKNKGKRRDKEDKLMRDGKSKDLFKKWSKKNQITYQRVGEEENRDITRKARDLFSYRKKRHGGPEGGDFEDDGFSRQGPGGRKNLGNKFGGKGGKPGKGGKGAQLRNPDQILKMKKKNMKTKLLNMTKGKRKQVMNKKGGGGGKKRR